MRGWLVLLFAVMACACSSSPVRIESRALADHQVSKSPEHFIIAAVDQRFGHGPPAFPTRSSTPRGYADGRHHGLRTEPERAPDDARAR